MLERGDVRLVSFDDALEREDRLIVLTVQLVEAACLVQRRQMLEVRFAEHLDELVERVVLLTVRDVGATQFEQRIHVLAVDLVRRSELQSRARDVARLKKSAAGLEISRD